MVHNRNNRSKKTWLVQQAAKERERGVPVLVREKFRCRNPGVTIEKVFLHPRCGLHSERASTLPSHPRDAATRLVLRKARIYDILDTSRIRRQKLRTPRRQSDRKVWPITPGDISFPLNLGTRLDISNWWQRWDRHQSCLRFFYTKKHFSSVSFLRHEFFNDTNSQLRLFFFFSCFSLHHRLEGN